MKVPLFVLFASLIALLSAAPADTTQVPEAEPGRSPLVIMPIGDSITAGAVAPGGFRDPLYTLLKNAGFNFQFAGSQKNVNNTPLLVSAGQQMHEGHGSYSSDLILGNLDGNMPPRRAPYGTPPNSNVGGCWLTGTGSRPAVYPDVILLMIGTNDLGMFRHTPAETIAHYDALVNKLAALRPHTYIICSTLIPFTRPEKYAPAKDYSHREADQLAFNAALVKLVAAHQAAGQRVRLYDMRGKVNPGNAATLISDDGVHPNQAGHRMIATGWFEAIQQLPNIESWRKARSANH